MKVLLIYPPYVTESSNLARVIKDKIPPLGLGYVAAALEEAGHRVEIIDAETQNLDFDQILNWVKEYQPQLIGLSTTTTIFHKAKELALFLKNKFSQASIVLGGPHLAGFPKATLEYDCFDYGVINEGEITIVELVNALEKGIDLNQVEGIVYKNQGEIIITEPRQFIQDLDKSPQVAWHLLSLDKYQDILGRRKNFATMITSRGCPYNCIYCERNCRLGRTYRTRSVKSIIKEIEKLYQKYNIREIIFYDDTFTFDKQRIKGLSDEIIERDWDLIWECRTRVDLVDEDLLVKMKAAGCYRIRFGVEAGNEDILKVLNKNITKDQVKNAFSLCKKHKIETFAYFMIGSPKETPQTVKETIDFAREIDADYAMFSPTQLQGQSTDLFQWAAEQGYIDEDYWQRWVKGEQLDSFPYLSTPDLSKEDVIRYVKIAYRNFYFRPKIILRLISKCRNIHILKKYFLLGLNMFSKKFRG